MRKSRCPAARFLGEVAVLPGGVVCPAERLRLKAGLRLEDGATYEAAIGLATPQDALHVNDVDHEVPVRLGEELVALRLVACGTLVVLILLREVAARNGPRGVMQTSARKAPFSEK